MKRTAKTPEQVKKNILFARRIINGWVKCAIKFAHEHSTVVSAFIEEKVFWDTTYAKEEGSLIHFSKEPCSITPFNKENIVSCLFISLDGKLTVTKHKIYECPHRIYGEKESVR